VAAAAEAKQRLETARREQEAARLQAGSEREGKEAAMRQVKKLEHESLKGAALAQIARLDQQAANQQAVNEREEKELLSSRSRNCSRAARSGAPGRRDVLLLDISMGIFIGISWDISISYELGIFGDNCWLLTVRRLLTAGRLWYT